MNPDRKIISDKIKIVNIKTLKGNIDGSLEGGSVSVTGHNFNFQSEIGFDIQTKIIGLKLVVDIGAIGQDERLLDMKGSYTHEIIFNVENMEDFTDSEQEEAAIDAMLGNTLISIAYSTIRGIIFTRTQGTSLGAVILPVINPSTLLQYREKGSIPKKEDKKPDKRKTKAIEDKQVINKKTKKQSS